MSKTDGTEPDNVEHMGDFPWQPPVTKQPLREQVKRIGNPAYRDNESTCYSYDELDELITLIENATLDDVIEVGNLLLEKYPPMLTKKGKAIAEYQDDIDNLRGK